MKERIQKLLEEVRPALERHGGDVEYVRFCKKDGCLRVRLKGSCKGCPMAQITLKAGIESYICDALPEVKEVVAVE